MALLIPNDPILRRAILGENDELLPKVALQTGASVHLGPRNDFPDHERPVWISGKDECIARAMQMLAVAVRVHAPFWKFPALVETMINTLNDTAKSAEVARLATFEEAHQDRWTVPHTVFVPEKALTVIRIAIKAGTFTTDCAEMKIDPVMTGKITLDAPTVNQSDSALIKLCDIVRRLEPGWMPDNEAARRVVEKADKHAGPRITPRQPAQTNSGHLEHNSQEAIFIAAQKNWQASPNSSRGAFAHSRKGSRHSSALYTGEAQTASPRRLMQI